MWEWKNTVSSRAQETEVQMVADEKQEKWLASADGFGARLSCQENRTRGDRLVGEPGEEE